jgi:hypothetical protein
MAVSDRLQTRLAKVPGVTSYDVAVWAEESVVESGLTESENENAVFYLALAIAYETIASDAARFFKYTDGEESVDKSNVHANYMKLATAARKNYRKHLRGRGASQSHIGRADER